jgi:hypothetical protein
MSTLQEYSLNTNKILLNGRFDDPNPSTKPTITSFMLKNIKPVSEVDGECVKLRWDHPKSLEWWLELFFNYKKPRETVIIKGRGVPFDASLTSYTVENGFARFRFDSKSNLPFWTEITIMD